MERTAVSAVPVTTRKVERIESAGGPEAVGTVRARVTSTIAAQMTGIVLEVRAQVGDRVTPGQPLVVIDAREIDARRAQAIATGNEARQAIPEADSAIRGAQASLDLAETTARRMKELLDKRSVSVQEFDEAQARVNVARSQVEMAAAKRRQLDERIRQAQENLALVETIGSYARVTSPFAGVVTERRVEPGALASPGTPLFVIEQSAGYRFEAEVAESAISQVRVGTQATVEIDSLDRTIQTRVSEIVPTLDPASRSFIVKLDLPAAAALRSGLFGRAHFAVGRESKLMIPVNAVERQGQVASVLMPDGEHARRRMISVGAQRDDQWEVLSGLDEGEDVIAPVPPGVTDGSPIEVKQ
jgi:RND family efflux transporter MFP subunit